jgi:hypothetical protein
VAVGGSGLGFNRAILLLTNERTNLLQGMMGVGPATWDEANRAWTEVARKHKSLMEWIQTGELFASRDSTVNEVARSIRVRLEPGEGPLIAETHAKERKATRETPPASPSCRPNSLKWSPSRRSSHFATAAICSTWRRKIRSEQSR